MIALIPDGLVGDGRTTETSAIQWALDICAQRGGWSSKAAATC